ncbi:cytochrome P450 [Streptomyces sp. NPDC060022]|uniref:cytochrome P450 n=1 Tax=Streptomyces sp. NPDC060022 TaxID=3347039 RepID=UPI0036973E4E
MASHGLEAIPVAPHRIPLLGHSRQLHYQPLEFMRSLHTGEPLKRIYLGTHAVCVLTDPELIVQVLRADRRHFDKGALFDELRPYIGNGLVTSAGDVHRRQRRMVQGGFHRERIAGVVSVMAQRADALAASWQPGQHIAVEKSMDALAFDILTRTMFAGPVDPDILPTIQTWLSRRIGAMQQTLSPMPRWIQSLPIPGRAPFQPETIAPLHHALDRLTASYRADGADHNDLLTLLMNAEDETGAKMTDQQIREELVTLLVAGTKTTSSSLAWILHSLASHPEVQRRVQGEVDEVLGGRLPVAADLSTLEYLQRTIREVLRMRSVWLLMRRVISPVTLGGVTLPPGTEVLYSPYAIHHDPRYYPRPDHFNPDRWTKEHRANLPKHAYMPFGTGSRICIGESFALVELATVIAIIMTRWNLHLTSDTPVRPVVGTLVRPGRLTLLASPRTASADV